MIGEMGLASAVVAVTGGLTAAVFIALAVKAGPGFLLYLAMLGDTAGWLLPGLVAHALPLGLLGGALLAGSERRDRDERVRPRQVLALTYLLTAATLVLTGWLMPEGYRATAAATARFTQAAEREGEAEAASKPSAPVSPAALDMPRLLEETSDEARADLWRRMVPVGGCLLAGLAAAALLATGLRFTSRQAMVLTSVLFLVQMLIWRP